MQISSGDIVFNKIQKKVQFQTQADVKVSLKGFNFLTSAVGSRTLHRFLHCSEQVTKQTSRGQADDLKSRHSETPAAHFIVFFL